MFGFRKFSVWCATKKWRNMKINYDYNKLELIINRSHDPSSSPQLLRLLSSCVYIIAHQGHSSKLCQLSLTHEQCAQYQTKQLPKYLGVVPSLFKHLGGLMWWAHVGSVMAYRLLMIICCLCSFHYHDYIDCDFSHSYYCCWLSILVQYFELMVDIIIFTITIL